MQEVHYRKNQELYKSGNILLKTDVRKATLHLHRPCIITDIKLCNEVWCKTCLPQKVRICITVVTFIYNLCLKDYL